jgi:hypothetical protein
MGYSFDKSLRLVRQKLGIDDDDWEMQSIKKDYYRYRIKTGLPLLYNKTAKVTQTAKNLSFSLL